MIKNFIFGKESKLTSSLIKNLSNVQVISSRNVDINFLKKNKIKTNYIFNNFYPSYKLNELKSSELQKFLDLSLGKLIQILLSLPKNSINKIIYTSSSSVYILDEDLYENKKDQYNRKLYASFKYSAEKIIQNYCQNKNIKFYVMRLFNTYGDDKDQFSFIEKLITIKKKNLELKLINNGISLRDFIHLSDVATIYKKFLKNSFEPGIYDIGTGQGKLIKNLVEFVQINKKKIINKNNVSQITRSIAHTNHLNKYLGNFQFKSLENYLVKKLKIKKTKDLLTTKIFLDKQKYEGSVIYGAGFAGKKLYLNLKDQKEKIIFFIDDDQKKQSTLVYGIPVISFDDLKKINKKKIIDKVFIAIPSLKKKKLNLINKKLSKHFFDVRYLPEKRFLINNQINLNDLKIDQINSFINRKQIKRKKILSLKNKNILVTGAAGTIGFEICRQLIYQNANKIIGIDQSELGIYHKKNKLDKKIKLLLCDVNNDLLLKKIINDNKIDLIIHAAAYKHVNILEENIISAVSNNILATKKICEIANSNKIDFILISTDKAAEPTSVLGLTKKVCEKLVNFYNCKNNKQNYFNIVRFGNVFGSSGSAITKFIDQINNNQAVSITNKKASRYFMTILEACYLVLETTTLKVKNKTFVLNMGNPINIYQVAKKIGMLKEKLDPSYKFKYYEIGLRKNEKLHEILFDKKEIKHKLGKNFFYLNRQEFNSKKFIKLFENLEKIYQKGNNKKILDNLKKICRI